MAVFCHISAWSVCNSCSLAGHDSASEMASRVQSLLRTQVQAHDHRDPRCSLCCTFERGGACWAVVILALAAAAALYPWKVALLLMIVSLLQLLERMREDRD